jgi:nucleotide-binding universal stress UspA family protein
MERKGGVNVHMKLLIGYDGSQCADGAIDDLRRAGLPADTEALVMSVAELPIEDPSEGYGAPKHVPLGLSAAAVHGARAIIDQAMGDAREHAAHGARRVCSLFPSWQVRGEAVAGSPYRAMVRKAQDWSADLVLVGSHGRSLVGRTILGSVSQHVLNHAPCSVRIGRCREGAAAAPSGGVKVILGIDGSPDAAAALEAVYSRGLARGWPAGTEVRVITTLDLKSSVALFWSGTWAEAGESNLSDPPAEPRRRVDAAAKELHEAGLAAVPIVLEGDAKKLLVHEAEQWGADCIFVGARGHTRIEQFLIGSVSAAVAARAHCSVEVVRS